jgi:hypothetical protein
MRPLLALVPLVLVAGCQAKLTPKIASGAPADPPGAVETPPTGPATETAPPPADSAATPAPAAPPAAPTQVEGLTLVRSQIQTRGGLIFSLGGDVVGAADAFDLVDDESGATLVAAVPLRANAEGPGFLFVFGADGIGRLRFFPLDPAIRDKLRYGTARLRLLAGAATSVADLTRRDFPVGELGTTRFPQAGSQRLGGFQGHFQAVSGRVRTPEGRTLSAGAFSTVNQ